MPVSVLTVDDEPRFRSALRSLAEAAWPGVAVDEAASGEAAVALAQERRPDVVLIDVRMPGMGGIAATSAIKRASPEALVLLVSSAHPDELPRGIDDCPADAIVSKERLRPKVLREAWVRHAGGRGARRQGVGQVAD